MIALTALWRRSLPWLALIAAILLFILGARRSGEQAGRAAERLQHTERTNDALRRMLEAGADRPRDRDDLARRLRDGRF
ncbi:hypothetical protein CG51_00825 [Haematobacter missouriensis]|uniref:Uncharacterized protein n=1 Tax=Haematobacter missouriensis TaxID=366616 RepID=A0A212AII6_9RHOB|nr:hypothetical protein [Haematobacter missouriensis]KFI32655.1 hypothetical protein CG51_00825 [Haematobacter missouriensis]OWJ79176.1 hypothetical protein CDV53_02535 [Haematobacter missouriensis]OWJ81321.1 hypothetical protein CDV52_18855 [Haematobacter missouriensis]